MRFYAFGNMYLSSIQQGIQAAHVVGNMSAKYGNGSDFKEWAVNHKTIVLLNGGMSCNLISIVDHFSDEENPYNWAYFTESMDALDGAITSVGIILPEDVYTTAAAIRSKMSPSTYGIMIEITWESGLYEILNSCGLAR